jgi:glycosyltransferase involved in cell wall biosynthesis
MSALLDLQGVQSRVHGERGIARYLTQLAAALERSFPRAVAEYLINPDLPLSQAMAALPPAHRLGSTDALPAKATIYHVGSAFEPDVSLDRLWPVRARKLHLVVTLYDLIPQIFAETYLAEPHVRGWYRSRLDLLRHADRILAISEATAKDAIDRLGVRPDRVVVAGAAPAPQFTPPKSREAALATVRERLPRIESGFVLYTGGIEFRKNIDRLLVAYAGLPESLRRAHQLVVVCKVLPAEREALETRLRGLGILERVYFTGFVDDEDLRLLYGCAHLFVFPSLYEGYGLPVAEAILCGAPVIASDSSSLVELVEEPAGRFDPFDVASIRATLTRALTDASLREQLRGDPSRVDTWEDVAARTAATYDELAQNPKRRRPRARPRIAYVSPLPPQWSGVADYSYRLLEPLSRYFEIDAFSDRLLGPAEAPPGIAVSSIGHFDTIERVRAGYDHVVICLGNSEHHASALQLLRRRGGVVLAHDVRLTGLYAYCADRRREIEPRSFRQILTEMYGSRLPAPLGEKGWIDPVEADAHGVFMAREAIAASDQYLVHSASAHQLARSDACPQDRTKVSVMPFAFPDPTQFAGLARGDGDAMIGTFGVVAAVKQSAKVLEAFALVARERADVTLAIVGPPAGDHDLRELTERAAELGLSDRVVLTGRVDDDRFRSLIAQTTVAVQLRSVSMGESPASVTDCLAAGVPTIATGIGATRELPDETVVKVAPNIDPESLGRLILALLDDKAQRARLGEAGRSLAAERSFERSAEFLTDLLTELGRRRVTSAA